MKQILITGALALGLGLLSTSGFASGYVVNGHAAAQLLVANGVEAAGKKCCYVLKRAFCD